MYNSSAVLKRSGMWVGEFMSPHFALLRQLTVKITGLKGFTGSGVILRVEPSSTYVLTAKHNIHTAGAAAGIESDADRMESFRTSGRVEFTALDGTVTTATIHSIALRDDQKSDSGYDVAVLRVEDRAFANVARGAASEGSPRRAFASTAWRNGGTQVVELRARSEARGVLFNGQEYRPHNPDQANWVLLQFGHGRVARGSDEFGFGFRVLRIPDMTGRSYLDSTKEGYLDVFTFKASDDTSTTYPGDSGGPLFAIDPTGQQSFLVGLALGANYYKDKIDNNEKSATENNAFAVLSTERFPQG